MFTSIEVFLSRPYLGSKKVKNSVKNTRKSTKTIFEPESNLSKRNYDSKVKNSTPLLIDIECFQSGNALATSINPLLTDEKYLKYKGIKDALQIDALFDEILNLTAKQVENLIKITEGVHDKENNLKYKVEIKEYQSDGKNNNIGEWNYQMRIDP